MTKYPLIRTKYSYLILTFLLLSIVSLILGVRVFAQDTPEDIAEEYGVEFPVSELEGCKDYSECRSYCEDPVHYSVCVDYAKDKGFYKEEEYKVDGDVLSRAKSSLGCSSINECKSFCQDEKNFDRCHRFAQSAGLAGGYKEDPRSKEFLDKAKDILGCASYDSCRNFCENPSNRDKCAEFARKIGVSGGYEYKGPGGCTTEETCKDFCTNPGNVEICKQFSSAHGGTFSGPGGCTDEDSCKAYCEKSPSSCPGFGQVAGNPSEYCSKTPGCSWTGTTCQCSSEGYSGDPATECAKYNCSWTGSYCQCGSTGDYQEKWQSECTKYPGCSWTGSTCQCTQSPTGGQYSAYPSSTPYSGGSGSYDPATECAKQSGCSWTGTTCQCSGSSSGGSSAPPPPPPPPSDPATECSQYPGCSWNGSSCQCQQVQGAKTETNDSNWLQDLLNSLF